MENQFKPRICVWEDISFASAEKLDDCDATMGDIQEELLEILGMSNEDKQSKIELDLYTNAILFAKTNNFNIHQISAFFTIIKSIHKLCISTPFDNQDQALELFNSLLIAHGVYRPPYSLLVFTLQQVEMISNYVLCSYFKHYKLYKYAFTKKVRLSLKLAYGDEVEQPPLVEKEESREEERDGEDTKSAKSLKEGEEVKEDQVEKSETDKEAVPSDDEPATVTEQTERPDHSAPLKDIVSTTLSKKLKDLEVSIEQEMSTQERKLAERISSLEKKVAEKTKHKK